MCTVSSVSWGLPLPKGSIFKNSSLSWYLVSVDRCFKHTLLSNFWTLSCNHLTIFSQVGVPNFASIPWIVSVLACLQNCRKSKPTSCLALEVMFLICLDQETSAEMVSLKYLILSTKSTGWPFRSKGLGFATCFLLDRIMALHFRGLKRRLTELAPRPNDVAIVSSSSHADKISIIGIHNKFWVCSQWPNTDPWGRPDIIGEKFKHVQLTTTCWFRPVRQLATHLTC